MYAHIQYGYTYTYTYTQHFFFGLVELFRILRLNDWLYNQLEQEQQLKFKNAGLRHHFETSALCMESSEEVFITQLHHRARLLDRSFNSKIIGMLEKTIEQILALDNKSDDANAVLYDV